MKRVLSIRQQHPAMQITWVINNICTNSCSYCPPNLHSGKNHHYDWSNARRFVDMLMDKYPLMNLSIAGGEPTLSPHILELVKIFNQRRHTISITTNGVRSVRFYEELSRYTNALMFSWHPAFEDPDFLDKVNTAHKNCLVTVRVMMDSRHWDRSVEFYNTAIENTDICVEPVRIQDWYVGNSLGRDYTPEQEEWFKYNVRKEASERATAGMPGLYIGSDYLFEDGTIDRSGSDPINLINAKLNDFRGWFCNIGLESLFVHWDGAIQRANCRQGDPRIIGNINEPESIQWPDRPEVCRQVECHCATDVAITKWHPDHRDQL